MNPKNDTKLSFGRDTSKITDCTRNILTGVPSSVADRLIAASIAGATMARPSSAVKLSGPWPHTLGESKNELFTTGTKIGRPSGTLTIRVVVHPKQPARNHT